MKKNEFYDRFVSRNENFVKMPINMSHKLNITIQIFLRSHIFSVNDTMIRETKVQTSKKLIN